MPESIILDPTELTTRTEFNITPWIAEAGPDWGEAQIEAAMAEQQVGAVPVDYSIPNRQVTIPLSIRDVGGTAFATARSLIQAKVGLWQAQGGYLKRVLASGGTVFADVVNAQLNLSGGWLQAHVSTDIEASVTLECIPDFYEAEETLSDHTETSAAELIFTETTTNGGDFPLGDRVRVVVDEDDGDSQLGLIWHCRGRHYSSASTAASKYEAEALQALDTATKVAKVGASGGTIVTHGTLSTNWTPVVGTNIGGTSYLTHTGTNRIWARVFSTAGTAVEARFVYDVGDLVNPVENNPVTLYNGGTFHILDLGEARLDPPPTGTHRWQGQIQARGQAGTESFSVDRIWIQNRDESAGVLQAPAPTTYGLLGPSARDEFNQSAGALTGKTAPVGGVWAGAGDTDDFSVETTGKTAQRTAVSDSAITNGRFATLPVSLAGLTAGVSVKASAVSIATDLHRFGVLVRYVNTSNYALLAYSSYSGSLYRRYLYKVVAGVVTATRVTFGGASHDIDLINLEGTLSPLGITIDAAGNWTVLNVGEESFTVLSEVQGYDADFATGGALASGAVGIYDAQTSATANTRNIDNLYVTATIPDAVMFASQSAELSAQGIIREDTGGTAYGPVSVVNGDLPRFPNQSSGGTVEVFFKSSRGDLQTSPDTGIDDISARVFRRASWLTVS
jgi:hypothetical protein